MMLDLQRMFQQPIQRHTQDMPAQPMSTTGGDFMSKLRPQGTGMLRLGDLFKNLFSGSLFNNHGGQSPAPQTPTAQTPQAPQPMGNQYANPFGASVTGGTLGAMLARQPNYN